MRNCRIVQYADMTKCERCGLAWDTNDPEPPECPYARTPQIGLTVQTILARGLGLLIAFAAVLLLGMAATIGFDWLMFIIRH